MTTKVSGGGGGGSTKPVELAYAEVGERQEIAVANEHAIVGLSVTVAIPTGNKFCIEFYCPEVSEDSGSTSGDLVSIAIESGAGHILATGHVYQTTGGVGSALFMRTGTITSDGTSTTYKVVVSNITNTNNGAILAASAGDPMYIRVVGL